MNKKYLPIILCLLPFAIFAGQIQTGRYITVTDKPKLSQQNPLEQTVSLTIPAEIQTVGEAINYLLQNTGYNLLPAKYRQDEASELLKQKLPLNDRSLKNTTVKNALLALAGNAYLLLVDPKHRYVSFNVLNQ
ncbi:MAG: PFGI-1 class ICE element type IV pilus protein PilL2 [Planctomycetota bacterium]|jgi:type IV pili sensor histidine kinase/response regulator